MDRQKIASMYRQKIASMDRQKIALDAKLELRKAMKHLDKASLLVDVLDDYSVFCHILSARETVRHATEFRRTNKFMSRL